VKRFCKVVKEILDEFTLNISRDVHDIKILVWTRSVFKKPKSVYGMASQGCIYKNLRVNID
jgi:hypothetical protein